MAEDRSHEFVTLVVLAALGAGAAILFAPEAGTRPRRAGRARRDKEVIGLTGFLLGAGVATLLTPESGSVTRQRLGHTLSRIKVGVVERIDRLRQRQADSPGPASDETPDLSVDQRFPDRSEVIE